MTESHSVAQIQRRVSIALLVPSGSEAQAARRKAFDKTAMQQLADNIKTADIINPILVRPIGEKYEIVAGERRFQAAKLAGLADVPVSVRELTDPQVLELQLIENLQREGLHELHEAEGYEQLKKNGHTADEIAVKVARSREYVFGRLKLLALCQAARAAFREGKINASTALHVARIPGDKMQQQALKEIVSGRQYSNRDEPMSSRAALDHIQKNYMLRLAGAAFDVTDEQLVRGAVACGRCPKNTALQPELFGDVKATSAGVCTDLPCFRSKCAAAVDARLSAAKTAGQDVIDGPAAAKLFPHGPKYNYGEFVSLDSKVWRGGNEVKYRKLVPEGTKVTLVRVRDRDTDTDIVVEAVPKSVADKAERADRPASSSASSSSADKKHREEVKKAKAETEVRRAIYAQLRPKLKTFTRATDELLVERLISALSFEDRYELARIHDPKIEKEASWRGVDGIAKKVKGMTDGELNKLLWDLVLVPEIRASAHNKDDAEHLVGYAKFYDVDVKKIRAAAAPAPAPVAKPKAKKAAKPSKKKGK